MKLVLALLLLVAAARFGYWLRNPDMMETFGEKSEWSILQSIEWSHRSSPIKEPVFLKYDNHEVMGLPDTKGGNVWIMLKPESPPYYKQMPPNVDYAIEQELIYKLMREDRIGYTTEEVMDSHALPSKPAAPQPNKKPTD